MTIEFTCECGEIFQVEDEFAGRKGRCPTCKRIMVVPDPARDLEPLELQDELNEEPSAPKVEKLIGEPQQEDLPKGKRVEEEVEVLRGWDSDGTEPLPSRENGGRKGIPRPWEILPRKIVLGIPAGILAILILWVALKPTTKAPPEDRSLRERPKMEAKAKSPEAPLQEPAPAPGPSPEPSVSKSQEPQALPKEAPPIKVEPKESQIQTPPPKSPPKEERRTSAPTPQPGVAQRQEPLPKGEITSKEAGPPAKSSMPGSLRAPVSQSGNYTVNVAAFKSQGMADAFAEVLRKRGLDPFVWSTDLKKGPGKMYRVSIGRFATKRQAELYAKELKEKHGFDTYVVKKPGT
jgi:cell division septation protein DedD